MSVLIVVAHPDDEVLALGGAAKGLGGAEIVKTCIMSASVQMRRQRPSDEELLTDIRRAHDIAGMRATHLGEFPNIKMNTVPHAELVQFIERAITDTRATKVFTHHPMDMNGDHRRVSRACQAAVRLFQRRNDIPPLLGFYYVEILSSTDWAFNVDASVFRPTGFLKIGKEGVMRKLEALSAYRHVMRKYPHPRSEEAVQGLAALRGAQAGVEYAEAVQVAFERLS